MAARKTPRSCRPTVIPQRGFCRYHRGDSLTGFAMCRLPLILAIFVVAMAPATAFENELLGKRDMNLPEYISEQGVLLFDEKGNATEFAIDFGSYKKQFVILLQKDTGAKTKTDSPVFEIIQVVRAPKPKGLDIYSVGCFLLPGPDAPPGQYVFAYAAFGADVKPRAIKGAWRFDWAQKKIVAVPDNKVDCREPGD
jgi:hypothetical protein